MLGSIFIRREADVDDPHLIIHGIFLMHVPMRLIIFESCRNDLVCLWALISSFRRLHITSFNRRKKARRKEWLPSRCWRRSAKAQTLMMDHWGSLHSRYANFQSQRCLFWSVHTFSSLPFLLPSLLSSLPHLKMDGTLLIECLDCPLVLLFPLSCLSLKRRSKRERGRECAFLGECSLTTIIYGM